MPQPSLTHAPSDRPARFLREIEDLRRVPRRPCDVALLRAASSLRLDDVFDVQATGPAWRDSAKRTGAFALPDGTGGVNPGDRRAIHSLIGVLAPSSVLEVGTHIGASTLHIASALLANQERGKRTSLVSVDIADVNCRTAMPWLKHGVSKSPKAMVQEMGCGAFVEFVAEPSLSYLAGTDRRFDFIFLDGDHAARTVYQEIPAALSRLNPNGVILLHDYFPNLMPLWSDGAVIPGPFLATERRVAEGERLIVQPLGALPWPTKLQSNVTSLALLLRG
jgi:predicted O-methyltransferase YrrM